MRKCCGVALPRGAVVVNGDAADMIPVLKKKPFMGEFCECSASVGIKAFESQLNDLPLNAGCR